MTVGEYLAAEAEAGRPVELTVWHPEHGSLRVPAYSVFDAKLQAAAAWGMGMDELDRMRAGMEKRSVTRLPSCG